MNATNQSLLYFKQRNLRKRKYFQMCAVGKYISHLSVALLLVWQLIHCWMWLWQNLQVGPFHKIRLKYCLEFYDTVLKIIFHVKLNDKCVKVKC